MKTVALITSLILILSCSRNEPSVVLKEDSVYVKTPDGSKVFVTPDSVVVKTPFGESIVSADSVVIR